MIKKLKTFFTLICITFLLPIFNSCKSTNTNKSNQTKIGIIGALEEEVAFLKEEMNDIKITTIAGMNFFEGKINGNKVIVVQSDMGKVNAAICSQTLINTFGANRIINTGVAGSLDAKIDIGDIVVSTDAIEHDFDLTPLGYAPGQVYNNGVVAFVADERSEDISFQVDPKRRASNAAAVVFIVGGHVGAVEGAGTQYMRGTVLMTAGRPKPPTAGNLAVSRFPFLVDRRAVGDRIRCRDAARLQIVFVFH